MYSQMVHDIETKRFCLYFLVKVGCPQHLDCVEQDRIFTTSDDFSRCLMDIVEWEYPSMHLCRVPELTSCLDLSLVLGNG